MLLSLNNKVFLLVVAFLTVGNVYAGKLRLPKIFSNAMVLQRDRATAIWGWADSDEKIRIAFHGQEVNAIADKDGKWYITLHPMHFGGPFETRIQGKSELVVLKNILIGDVWVCSGQSNMEFPVSGWAKVKDYKSEIAQANYPKIRLFNVEKNINTHPQEDVKGGVWQECSPSTISPFSAVGYFFGRDLYNTLQIPIGLINSAWGGTEIESWISRPSLDTSEEFKTSVAKLLIPDTDSLRKKENGKLSPNGYPSLLYNAMINPLIQFKIKGTIWYQGESNVTRAYQYKEALPLLIKDWRRNWQENNFPFYYVQISSFNALYGNSNKGSTWAELRESQTKTLSLLPGIGMAVTTDIGDPLDIHPTNKQGVGRRLATLALIHTYGKRIIAGGPVFQNMKITGTRAFISFTQIGSGLLVKGDTLCGYEIAGADKVFYPAEANVEGNKVIVFSDRVAFPVSVRYGWADDASQINLFNKEGFPVAPFRTDQWPSITKDVKYTPIHF